MNRNPRPATCTTDEQTIVYPPAPAYSSAPPTAASRAPVTKPAANAQFRETAVPPSSLFARYDEPSPNPTPKPTSKVIQTRCEPTPMPTTYAPTGDWAFDQGQRAGDTPVITLQPTDPSSYRYSFVPTSAALNEPHTADHVIMCPKQFDPISDQDVASWWWQQTGKFIVLPNSPYTTFFKQPTCPAPAATRDPAARAEQRPPFPEDPFPTEPNAEVAMDDSVGATLVALLKHMDERMSRIEERQDALGNAFSQQNQVIASLATTTPTRLPASPTFPALPANIPGTSIQPAAPAYPAPMMTGMYPAAYPQPGQGQYLPANLPPPLVRRDIKQVILHSPNRQEQILPISENTTSFDLDTLTETNEVSDHAHRNRDGEPINLDQPVSACFQCGELLGDPPRRCTICEAPLCRQHAWTCRIEDPEGSGTHRTEYYCEGHGRARSGGLVGSLLRSLFS